MRLIHSFFPITLVAILFMLPGEMYSQEQLGMRLERYAGIYSTGINPANSAFTPHNWEVSLFNADVFAENSYAFLRNTSLQNALRNSDQIVSITDTSSENPLPRNAILQDFANQSRKMHVVTQTRVAGPSFSFRFGENNVVGLTFAVRNNVSAYKIPEILRYQTISDLPRGTATNIPAVGLAGMAWSEIGLHYSRLEEMGDLQMAWGVSPKLLLGYEGFFVQAQSSFDYTQNQGDTVAFAKANWDYAMTTGNLTGNSEDVKLRRQGSGMSMDLGASWAMPDEENGYTWRAGVSLLDLGFMHFKNTAERHHIGFDSTLTVSGADFGAHDNPVDYLRDISQAFLGDSLASLQKRAFGMGLPTALSAQIDVKVAPLFYVSGLLIQRVPLSKFSVKRPSTLAVVPRFEHRWFSVSIPLVVDDWRKFRAGAALRLGWLYVGTDNVGSFLSANKLSGTDAYIGLKINGFNLHFKQQEKGYKLHKESGSRSSGPNRRKIKCYSF